MKQLITAFGIVFLVGCQTFTGGRSTLARVTVYWPGEGSGEQAAWHGKRLREPHCAVDPKKIPYGSKVVLPDATCLAVDTGPAVVNRTAARSSGRNAAECNAIVIDRFFATKKKALAWAKAHPHFMTGRILTPGNELVATKNPSSSSGSIASGAKTSWSERTE